jgi:hypothetical protein
VGSNHVWQFIVDDSEESDEEDAVVEDEEPLSDEEEDLWEEDMALSAEPGQEGISLWDLLGEGFLVKAAKLGVSVGLIPLLISYIVSEGELLDESDLSLLQASLTKHSTNFTLLSLRLP